METWINGDEADKVIKDIKLDSNIRIETAGFFGGIWALWNEDQIQLNMIRRHKRFMHMKLYWNDDDPWFFVAVYGSPNPTAREDL